MKLKINSRIEFNTEKPPLIISEISGNHCGSKNKFLDLIKKAHDSGADLVKIQTYEPQDITVNSNHPNFTIKGGLWNNKTFWSIYKKACTPFNWHDDAFNLASKRKINLFSTPFSIRAANLLKSFNVSLYKIASLEITDLRLVKHIASFNKPIIISTGASKLQEVKKAIQTIRKYHNKIIILHCVSGYPTKIEDANVKRITYLKNNFKNNMIGLSDHTDNIYSSLASVPLGIVAIEKHLKISEKSKTLDSEFSITPKQLSYLKEYSVNIFKSYGKLKKENTVDKSIRVMRRSLYAKTNIKKGEKIKLSQINILRPLIGIPAEKYLSVINKKAKIDIKKDTPINWKVIS